MSQSTVASFFDFAKTSESIKEQLEAGISSNNLITVASQKGYEFNAQELKGYLANNKIDQSLSIEELESVAGGIEWEVTVKVSSK